MQAQAKSFKPRGMLSIRVSEDVRTKLAIMCDVENRSMGGFIELLIKNEYERLQKNNSEQD